MVIMGGKEGGGGKEERGRKISLTIYVHDTNLRCQTTATPRIAGCVVAVHQNHLKHIYEKEI